MGYRLIGIRLVREQPSHKYAACTKLRCRWVRSLNKTRQGETGLADPGLLASMCNHKPYLPLRLPTYTYGPARPASVSTTASLNNRQTSSRFLCDSEQTCLHSITLLRLDDESLCRMDASELHLLILLNC